MFETRQPPEGALEGAILHILPTAVGAPEGELTVHWNRESIATMHPLLIGCSL